MLDPRPPPMATRSSSEKAEPSALKAEEARRCPADSVDIDLRTKGGPSGTPFCMFPFVLVTVLGDVGTEFGD